jgi:hypothetical protein
LAVEPFNFNQWDDDILGLAKVSLAAPLNVLIGVYSESILSIVE